MPLSFTSVDLTFMAAISLGNSVGLVISLGNSVGLGVTCITGRPTSTVPDKP